MNLKVWKFRVTFVGFQGTVQEMVSFQGTVQEIVSFQGTVQETWQSFTVQKSMSGRDEDLLIFWLPDPLLFSTDI